MLRAYWRYSLYIAKHKWFVYVGCRRLGVSMWQAIVHDMSKFLPDEFVPYAVKFYGPKRQSMPNQGADARSSKGYYHQEGKDPAFDAAWRKHLARNLHHWQFYMQPDHERWSFQAHQPEIGPYFLALDSEPIAIFDTPFLDGTSDEAYDLTNFVHSRLRAIPMPERYVREMVCDWWGAGKSQGKPDIVGWYEDNKNKIVLHDDSRRLCELFLYTYFGAGSGYDKETGRWRTGNQ